MRPHIVYFQVVLALLECATGSQITLESIPDISLDENIKRDAFHVFNSMNHLLRQWGSTLSPNGFSYSRATVPANTQLFHARMGPNTPPNPEWLAFDPEMAYGIKNVLCTPFIQTYKSSRTLGPLLYLDGSSASLTPSGTLDSQDILLYGSVRPKNGTRRDVEMFDDITRAKRLCAWGEPLGVEGFVRQNTGYELLWCDWNKGIELVNNINVTRWMKDMDPTRPCRPYEHGKSPKPVDIIFNSFDESTFVASEPPALPADSFHWFTGWEWIRSAVAVYSSVGESRVHLDAAFVTAYGRAGVHVDSTDDASLHRLVNMTTSAVTRLQDDVAGLFRTNRTTSGIDWRAVTDQIINRYGRRIPQIQGHLINGTRTSIRQAHMIVASLLVPHFDFELEIAGSLTTLESCTDMYTPKVTAPWWSESEVAVQRRSVHIVQRAICQTLLDIHKEISTIPPSPSPSPFSKSDRAILATATSRITELISRIDWKVWTTCEQQCEWDEECLIPMWPTSGWDLGGRPTPQCANSAHWIVGTMQPGFPP